METIRADHRFYFQKKWRLIRLHNEKGRELSGDDFREWKGSWETEFETTLRNLSGVRDALRAQTEFPLQIIDSNIAIAYPGGCDTDGEKLQYIMSLENKLIELFGDDYAGSRAILAFNISEEGKRLCKSVGLLPMEITRNLYASFII